MLNEFTNYIQDLIIRFKDDEEGLALTEYVLLLGLLAGTVIAAVLLFGENLNTLWNGWATYMGTVSGAPT